MEEMRRSKRQMEQGAIKELIEAQHVLRIGLIDETFPYVVPVNYGYAWQGDQLIFYIHGAVVGKKVRLIEKNPHVCVEIDGKHALIETGMRAEGYSFAYESFIGYGKAEIVTDTTEKLHGLALLMQHETGKALTEFDPIPEKMVERTGIIKIVISEFSGKHHQLPEKSEA